MVETAEKIRREAFPPTKGKDLATAAEEGDVERIAQYVRENFLAVDGTVRAIKEHVTMDHMKRMASVKAREAIATPERRRKGLVALSAVGIGGAIFGAISYALSRRRKHSAR